MRGAMLRAILVILSVLPIAASAQSLSESVQALLRALVQNDDQEFLREFIPPTSVDWNPEIRELISGTCERADAEYQPHCRYFSEQAEEQIPSEVRREIRDGANFKILELESCAIKLGKYGIPSYEITPMYDYAPIDEHLIKAEIERLRIQEALSLEGLKLSDKYKYHLNLFDHKPLNALNRAIYLVKKDPILVITRFQDGCGAGANFVRVILAQPLDSLLAIPAFYYDLCAADGISPWNMSACPGVIPNPQLLSSGVWRYRATLAGCVREGSFDTEFLEVNQSTFDAEFTIPEPNC